MCMRISGMYVCMSVRNGFTIEIYGVTYSLRTSFARAAYDAIAMKIEVEDRRQRVQMIEDCLTKDATR